MDDSHDFMFLSIFWISPACAINPEAWLKPYIDINTKLRTVAKDDFEKDFFKLINNTVFGKAMKNVRKHKDNKLVTTDKRRNQLASKA